MMKNSLTKRDLLSVFKNQAAIAAKLGVSRGTVCKWNDDEPIPELHDLRLRFVLMADFDWSKIATGPARADR